MIRGCIFDLDGVIVDTAKYHYLAWKRMASLLGVAFTEEDNEHLKGVSRMQSLQYILNKGGIKCSDEDKQKYAKAKNEWYVDYISTIDETEILPGAQELLIDLKKNNVGIALGSASKNAKPLLKNIHLIDFFDFISDGNSTEKSKPDPDVFLIAAKGLNLQPAYCIVFEDSVKGIEAALKGGFRSMGIGDKNVLNGAEHTMPGLSGLSWEVLEKLY
ncbi:MAG: beta-phosphoglucomutase [Saprospiraceae bacterium]|nr:beta-phosphoglucomutase [Saprospiraceae bacterium]